MTVTMCDMCGCKITYLGKLTKTATLKFRSESTYDLCQTCFDQLGADLTKGRRAVATCLKSLGEDIIE